MTGLSLTTPALLFSSISLIMLIYTTSKHQSSDEVFKKIVEELNSIKKGLIL